MEQVLALRHTNHLISLELVTTDCAWLTFLLVIVVSPLELHLLQVLPNVMLDEVLWAGLDAQIMNLFSDFDHHAFAGAIPHNEDKDEKEDDAGHHVDHVPRQLGTVIEYIGRVSVINDHIERVFSLNVLIARLNNRDAFRVHFHIDQEACHWDIGANLEEILAAVGIIQSWAQFISIFAEIIEALN